MDKCERWNKIAPLQHKGCNFIVPQALTYTAIVLLVLYFIAFNYRAIFDTNAERSEACVLKECIKNCSTVKLYNKVLIITNVGSVLEGKWGK